MKKIHFNYALNYGWCLNIPLTHSCSNLPTNNPSPSMLAHCFSAQKSVASTTKGNPTSSTSLQPDFVARSIDQKRPQIVTCIPFYVVSFLSDFCLSHLF